MGLSASRKQVDSLQKDVMQALVNAVVQIGGTAEAQAALRQHLPHQVSLSQPLASWYQCPAQVTYQLLSLASSPNPQLFNSG